MYLNVIEYNSEKDPNFCYIFDFSSFFLMISILNLVYFFASLIILYFVVTVSRNVQCGTSHFFYAHPFYIF